MIEKTGITVSDIGTLAEVCREEFPRLQAMGHEQFRATVECITAWICNSWFAGRVDSTDIAVIKSVVVAYFGESKN